MRDQTIFVLNQGNLFTQIPPINIGIFKIFVLPW